MNHDATGTNDVTDTDAMAAATRSIADRDDGQVVAAGSRDTGPSDTSDADDFEHLHQAGAGQSDDVSGQAPASSMAKQHANPARREGDGGSDGEQAEPLPEATTPEAQQKAG